MVFDEIPGESRAKTIILGAYKTGRLPNAYIFSGNNTEEMSLAVKDLAKLLNCGSFCGICLNCSKIEKDIHPDFITVVPEGKKQIIKIDSVKELKDRIKFGPSEGSYMVARIVGADSIEAPAANSFLKTLEEPPEKVLFVLVTQRPDNLPKTVISRCQKVIFANQGPTAEALEPALSKGDIHGALEFSETMLAGSRETEREDTLKRLEGLLVYYWRGRKAAEARIVMDAFKRIKKMGNARLSMDNMALALGGCN